MNRILIALLMLLGSCFTSTLQASGPAFGMASTLSNGGGTDGPLLAHVNHHYDLGALTRPACALTTLSQVAIRIDASSSFWYQLTHFSVSTPAAAEGQPLAPLHFNIPYGILGGIMQEKPPFALGTTAEIPLLMAIPSCLDPQGTVALPTGTYTITLTIAGAYWNTIGGVGFGFVQPIGMPPPSATPFSQTISFSFDVTTGPGSGHFGTFFTLAPATSVDYNFYYLSSNQTISKRISMTQAPLHWTVHHQGDYATITLTQRKASRNSLKIYDLQGRLVATPFQQLYMEEGVHKQKISLAGLPKGILLLSLQSDGQQSVKRIIH